MSDQRFVPVGAKGKWKVTNLRVGLFESLCKQDNASNQRSVFCSCSSERKMKGNMSVTAEACPPPTFCPLPPDPLYPEKIALEVPILKTMPSFANSIPNGVRATLMMAGLFNVLYSRRRRVRFRRQLDDGGRSPANAIPPTTGHYRVNDPTWRNRWQTPRCHAMSTRSVQGAFDPSPPPSPRRHPTGGTGSLLPLLLSIRAFRQGGCVRVSHTPGEHDTWIFLKNLQRHLCATTMAALFWRGRATVLKDKVNSPEKEHFWLLVTRVVGRRTLRCSFRVPERWSVPSIAASVASGVQLGSGAWGFCLFCWCCFHRLL